jgi:hypothetical protein
VISDQLSVADAEKPGRDLLILSILIKLTTTRSATRKELIQIGTFLKEPKVVTFGGGGVSLA